MEPRTLETLRTMTRERLSDLGQSRPKWSNAMIDRSLSEAQHEAALTARLLRDEVTPAIVNVSVVAGTSIYTLHRSIFDVDGVIDETNGCELDETSEAVLRNLDAGWRARESTTARNYVIRAMPDERLQLILYPKPTVEATYRLQTYRYPRYPLEHDSDEPEIAPIHHDGLVAWACYRLLSNRDPDMYDPVKAAEHKAEFRRQFGPEIDADTRRNLREKTSNIIKARNF